MQSEKTNSATIRREEQRAARVRGFTFTEIMFAVIILGLGFIMIAAIFPVAIKQGQSSAEETMAIGEAQRAITAISTRATSDLFPPTSWDYDDTLVADGSRHLPSDPSGGAYVALGEVYKDCRNSAANSQNWMVRLPGSTFTATNNITSDRTALERSELAVAKQWAAFRGDLLSKADPRYGVAIAYSRMGRVNYNHLGFVGEVAESNVVNVIAVVAQIRTRSLMNEGDLGGTNTDWAQDVRIPQSASGTWNSFQRVDVQRLIKNDGSGGMTDPSGLGTLPSQGGTPATLQFKRLLATFYTPTNAGTGEPDRVRFLNVSTDNNRNVMWTGHYSCVAPGTYVIVADASNSNPLQVKTAATPTSLYNVRANGRVFRVGEPVEGSQDTDGFYTDYNLVPGQDVSSIPDPRDRPPYSTDLATKPLYCEVLVLGRALKNPTTLINTFPDTTNPYIGPAMDVAVYTSSFTLR